MQSSEYTLDYADYDHTFVQSITLRDVPLGQSAKTAIFLKRQRHVAEALYVIANGTNVTRGRAAEENLHGLIKHAYGLMIDKMNGADDET